MRACQVIDRLTGGGQERVAAEFAIGLKPRLAQSALLATRGGGDYEALLRDAGVPTLVTERRRRLDPLAWGRIALWLREQDFDVVHTHSPGSLTAMLKLRRSPGLRYRIVSHIQMLQPLGTAFRDEAIRWHKAARDRIDSTVVTNEELREYLIANWGYRPDRVVAMPNPVDFDGWDERARGAAGLPDGWDDGEPVVSMIAQWRPQKDHGTAIEAAGLLAARGVRARWIFVGDGDAGLTAAARARVSELGLDDRVWFAGRRQDVPALLAHSDVGLLSTRFEGLPVAVVEYCAAGIASIVSDVEGTHELIAPGNGIVGVAPEDATALAAALEDLLADRQRLQELGTRARAAMRERADTPVVMAAIERLYDRIASNGARA